MMKEKSIKKVVLFIALLTAGVICAIWLSSFVSTSSTEDWQKRTSPLSQDVKDDLCTKFDLSKKGQLCIPNQAVFASDFYPAIEKYFTKELSSFQDVQVLLEPYLVYLEDPSITKDSTYFLAWYDFRGDGMSALVFYFDGDHQNNKLKGFNEFFWQPGDFKAGEE